MAGVLGVSITEAMSKKRILSACDAGRLVTPAGAGFFGELEIDGEELQRRRPPLRQTCLDWSEWRYHLAGALGDAAANRYFELGWVARACGRAGLCV